MTTPSEDFTTSTASVLETTALHLRYQTHTEAITAALEDLQGTLTPSRAIRVVRRRLETFGNPTTIHPDEKR